MRLTVKEFKEKFKVNPGKHKYGAKPKKNTSGTFRSSLEERIDRLLITLVRVQAIKSYQREIPFIILQNKSKRKIRRHFIDFELTLRDDTKLYIEAKGYETALGKLKRELVEHIYDLQIHVVKNESDVLKLVEEIIKYG